MLWIVLAACQTPTPPLVEADPAALRVTPLRLFAPEFAIGADAAADEAIGFWDELAKHIPEWQLVNKSKMTAGEIRRDFVHSHGVLLQAFGRIGASMNAGAKPDYRSLVNVKKINWSRSNAKDWEGRVMMGGRLTKASNSVVLASAFIKHIIGMELSPEEIRADTAFNKSRVKK